MNRAWIRFAIAAALAPELEMASAQIAPDTQLVSQNASGTAAGNNQSYGADISDDGSRIVFQSLSSDLVANDTNGDYDVFLRDLQSSTTTLVSVSLSGGPGNGRSDSGRISADGRYVTFSSGASDLVAGDTFQSWDVFVRDLVLGTTAVASVGLGGAKPNQDCAESTISGDGRYVCFRSRASNLVAGDTNGNFDLFVRDMLNGTTVRVNVTATGAQSAFSVEEGAEICDDGRHVAFSTLEPLVPGDLNNRSDVFLKDFLSGSIEIVSLGHQGQQANDASYRPSLSADARYVAFGSWANNLVPNDQNNAPSWSGDVFLRDRQTATTRMVNLTAGGEQQVGSTSDEPAISPDGRYVAFGTVLHLIPWSGVANLEHVYVKDLRTEALYRANQGPSGEIADGRSFRGAVARDGARIAFDTTSSNFGWPDSNGTLDVYGHTLGAPVPTTYCTSKVSSLGCTPRISWSGWPGLSNLNHFYVVGGVMLNNTTGLMLYGVNGRAAIPFSGGYLCVQAPVKRAVTTMSSGNSTPGTRCDAAFWIDFQSFASGALGGHPLPALQVPGTTVDAQWWGRDTALPVDPTQLSDAIEFQVMP